MLKPKSGGMTEAILHNWCVCSSLQGAGLQLLNEKVMSWLRHLSERQNYSTQRRTATFRVYPGILQGIPHFGRCQPLCTASVDLFAFRSCLVCFPWAVSYEAGSGRATTLWMSLFAIRCVARGAGPRNELPLGNQFSRWLLAIPSYICFVNSPCRGHLCFSKVMTCISRCCVRRITSTQHLPTSIQ